MSPMLKRFPTARSYVSDAFSSFVEVCSIYLFTIVPFGFAAFIYVALTPGSVFNFTTLTDVIRMNVNVGDVFIHACGIFGSIIYVFFTYFSGRRHMPLYNIFLLLPFVSICAASFIFFLDRAAVHSELIINKPFIDSAAVYIYLLIIISWFFCIFYIRRAGKITPHRADPAEKIRESLSE